MDTGFEPNTYRSSISVFEHSFTKADWALAKRSYRKWFPWAKWYLHYLSNRWRNPVYTFRLSASCEARVKGTPPSQCFPFHICLPLPEQEFHRDITMKRYLCTEKIISNVGYGVRVKVIVSTRVCYKCVLWYFGFYRIGSAVHCYHSKFQKEDYGGSRDKGGRKSKRGHQVILLLFFFFSDGLKIKVDKRIWCWCVREREPGDLGGPILMVRGKSKIYVHIFQGSDLQDEEVRLWYIIGMFGHSTTHSYIMSPYFPS